MTPHIFLSPLKIFVGNKTHKKCYLRKKRNLNCKKVAKAKNISRYLQLVPTYFSPSQTQKRIRLIGRNHLKSVFNLKLPNLRDKQSLPFRLQSLRNHRVKKNIKIFKDLHRAKDVCTPRRKLMELEEVISFEFEENFCSSHKRHP